MNSDAFQHSMSRRSQHHDYCRPGTYHVTMHVAEGVGSPLGRVTGDAEAPDGHPDAPRVALSPAGQMVEHELLTAITAHYPMVEVQDYVVMPDHLHFLVVVKTPIVSASGKRLPLGQVIAGFKKGCNRLFWELTGNAAGAAAAPAAAAPAAAPAAARVAGGFPAGIRAGAAAGTAAGKYKVPSAATSGRQPLFAPGYCDVMPVDAEQLATQRTYIRDNPRSRLLRTGHRDWLMPRRGAVATALTLPALLGFLRRECAPSQASPDTLADLAGRLLLSQPGKPAATVPAVPVSAGFPGGDAVPALAGFPGGDATPALAGFPGGDAVPAPAGFPGGRPCICCDSYGDRSLLGRCLLPVVCHRKDKARLAEQKTRCLAEARGGAVLVSARIAKGEQEIIDAAVYDGFPVVLILDNGFPDRYHPSAAQLDRCAAGRLLIVTPWRYRYRGRQEAITVAECKAMNCLAQALCRLKDDWWKRPGKPAATLKAAPAPAGFPGEAAAPAPAGFPGEAAAPVPTGFPGEAAAPVHAGFPGGEKK